MKEGPTHGLIVIVSLIVVCAGQAALAQVDWTYEDLAVPPGAPGSWDSVNHHVGEVIFDGSIYHMYLVGGPTTVIWESSFAVGHWTSPSLAGPWTEDPANPVLETEPGQWDAWTIYGIAVHYDGTGFRMWYGATASYLGAVSVGLATNADGWGDWDKHPGNPVSGLAPGDPGSWDDWGMSPNTVLFDGLVYGLWYTAIKDNGSYGTWRLGYASSIDGITWIKHPDPLLVGTEPWEGDNVYNPTVVPLQDGFAMWYSGLVPGHTAIGYAVSPDGLNWRKYPDNPVIVPQAGCDVVESFAVIFDGDTIHGWTDHCYNIYHSTSPFELLFFDGFESGDTIVWGSEVP